MRSQKNGSQSSIDARAWITVLPYSAEPVVWDQAELSLYEELWDAARTLTESEAKPLAKIYKDKEVEGTFIHFLKDHHRYACVVLECPGLRIIFRKPLTLDEGKSIYSHQWGEILFHLNKIVSRARFPFNSTLVQH